eukprot:SAG11_NODE_2607_length_3175_cov_11.018205_2_plen_486_part_00
MRARGTSPRPKVAERRADLMAVKVSVVLPGSHELTTLLVVAGESGRAAARRFAASHSLTPQAAARLAQHIEARRQMRLVAKQNAAPAMAEPEPEPPEPLAPTPAPAPAPAPAAAQWRSPATRLTRYQRAPGIINRHSCAATPSSRSATGESAHSGASTDSEATSQSRRAKHQRYPVSGGRATPRRKSAAAAATCMVEETEAKVEVLQDATVSQESEPPPGCVEIDEANYKVQKYRTKLAAANAAAVPGEYMPYSIASIPIDFEWYVKQQSKYCRGRADSTAHFVRLHSCVRACAYVCALVCWFVRVCVCVFMSGVGVWGAAAKRRDYQRKLDLYSSARHQIADAPSGRRRAAVRIEVPSESTATITALTDAARWADAAPGHAVGLRTPPRGGGVAAGSKSVDVGEAGRTPKDVRRMAGLGDEPTGARRSRRVDGDLQRRRRPMVEMAGGHMLTVAQQLRQRRQKLRESQQPWAKVRIVVTVVQVC